MEVVAMEQNIHPKEALSRSRLRQIGLWIRDELDVYIARDGPQYLRPDDVITLHDFFQALRTSSSITVSDLRASGIHNAIVELSGKATRWPKRLVDECDKIISIWTTTFGPLQDIHPFLYGRGGRLEGIASVGEYSKQTLMNRWQRQCPNKISSKRSHRHGDLGFQAGQWWINPLFAWHAGIIDGDTVEGGICYDKETAYAILLKGSGEIDAKDETHFTYRCTKNDKGKYRLTAATPKCRHRIRILRSHSINSIWGPRAGVRYDGLFRIAGWSIRQMKAPDTGEQSNIVGDIVYDIRLERDDPIPMQEVVKIPTATQVDEYSEYKRLQLLWRNLQQKAVESSGVPQAPVPTKVAPPIMPAGPQPPVKSPVKAPSIVARSPTFIRPFGNNQPLPSPAPSIRKVGRRVPATSYFNGELFLSPVKSTVAVTPHTQAMSKSPPGSSAGSLRNIHLPTSGGTPGSSMTPSSPPNITEVAPWIASEIQPIILPDDPPPVIPQHLAGKSKTKTTLTMRPSARRNPSPQVTQTGSLLKLESFIERKSSPSSPGSSKGRDSQKSVFTRSRNPMAKVLDGAAGDGAGDVTAGRTQLRRSTSTVLHRTPPKTPRQMRASSSGAQPLSPIPVRTLSLLGSWLNERRDPFSSPYEDVIEDDAPARGEGISAIDEPVVDASQHARDARS